MTVLYVTRRTDHQIQPNQPIHVLNPEELNLYQSLRKQSGTHYRDTISRTYNDWYVIPHDIENRFYRVPKPEGLLLSAFCINDTFGQEEVIVIDNTSVKNTEVFTQDILKRTLFISHNADHEAIWGAATAFLPERYACTMVNDRRLLSGQEGFRFDLISVINRRLGYQYIPPYMDKDIRSQFKDCTFFTGEQILYNAADTIRLRATYNKQLELANEMDQSFLHVSINSRIIIPIACAEHRGIRHNSDKWIGIAKERKQKADEICQKLDQILLTHGIDAGRINPAVKKKRESLEKRKAKNQEREQKLIQQLQRLEESSKTHLKSYQVTKEALLKLQSSTQESVEEGDGLINWGSPKQVLEIFRQMGCPIPQAKDHETKKMKPSLNKDARATWFVNHPDSPHHEFMKQFDAMKKLVHNVTSFGEKWVSDYVIPETGRIHTRLDQAGADTGRFSSGSKSKTEKLYPNMQQIPKPPEYRECFIADPGRKILTADYKNCEGVLMIAQSGDLNMKRITELPDQHSYLGTKCWRNVYDHRHQKTGDPKWGFLAENYEMNKTTPEKVKERDKFKNSGGLFPVAYGVFASKVAGAAGISEDEGQIMIDTIKAEIPLVIEYLDNVAQKAVRTGYVVHNRRTGSRRWFQSILDHKHYDWKLIKGDIVEVQSAARNSVIQGTNSDLIKEAIAMLHMWAKIFKQDIFFMLTVHDELVCDCPEGQEEYYLSKLEQLMIRAAKNYLIPEIDMQVDGNHGNTWTK